MKEDLKLEDEDSEIVITSLKDLSNTDNQQHIPTTIHAMLISAVWDKEPPKSLAQVKEIIQRWNLEESMNVFDNLPLLLPVDDDSARELIGIIGKYISPWEIVLAAQEAVERIENDVAKEDEESEDEDNSKSKGQMNYREASKVAQILTLIELNAAAIPRLIKRRKTAAETLQPIVDSLERALTTAAHISGPNEWDALMNAITKVVTGAGTWVARHLDAEHIVKSLVDRALSLYCASVRTSVAQRTLEEYFPRLKKKTTNSLHDQAVLKLLDAHTFATVSDKASATDLFHNAYYPLEGINPLKRLEYLFPVLLSSIQTNTFLDQSLAVLIKVLHICDTSIPKIILPANLTLPLCGVLSTIASAHPDSDVRHQAFRILALLLASSEPQVRFQELVELTRDSEYPQMRVAAIGLVKDALIQALGNPKDSFLAGHMFLRTFGPVLFKSDPPDLFIGDSLTLKDFQESSEPMRLVECLSLYYVLLLRDVKNQTGIRDKDVLASVEHGLLTPLRKTINRWVSDPVIEKIHMHDITPIASLQTGLQRVDTAIASLL